MTFSSKCLLCKPSSMVRLSKSGRLILVNTTFILFSSRLFGLLVHSPVFCGMLELWKKAAFYLCKKSASQSLIVFSCLTWAVFALRTRQLVVLHLVVRGGCTRWLVSWHSPLLEEVVPRWGQKWSEWSSVGPGVSTCLSDEPKRPWNCEKRHTTSLPYVLYALSPGNIVRQNVEERKETRSLVTFLWFGENLATFR